MRILGVNHADNLHCRDIADRQTLGVAGGFEERMVGQARHFHCPHSDHSNAITDSDNQLKYDEECKGINRDGPWSCTPGRVSKESSPSAFLYTNANAPFRLSPQHHLRLY